MLPLAARALLSASALRPWLTRQLAGLLFLVPRAAGKTTMARAGWCFDLESILIASAAALDSDSSATSVDLDWWARPSAPTASDQLAVGRIATYFARRPGLVAVANVNPSLLDTGFTNLGVAAVIPSANLHSDMASTRALTVRPAQDWWLSRNALLSAATSSHLPVIDWATAKLAVSARLTERNVV